MIKLTDIFLEKVGYYPNKAPDSIKSRTMAGRKAVKTPDINPLTGEEDPDKGNEQQANGAEIAKKMDFDKAKPRSINDKSPLSMMDIIFNIWSGYDDEIEIKKRQEKEDKKRAEFNMKGPVRSRHV